MFLSIWHVCSDSEVSAELAAARKDVERRLSRTYHSHTSQTSRTPIGSAPKGMLCVSAL